MVLLAGSSESPQLPLLPVNPTLLQTRSVGSSSALSLKSSESSEFSSTSSPLVIVSDGIPTLPTKLVKKIRRWEYINLSKLITVDTNDHVTSTMVINGQVVTVEPIPQAHRRHSQLDVISWMEAYSKFLAVLVAAETTSHEEAAGLAAHMFQVVRPSKTRGFKWLTYDTEYREWAAAKNIRIWGEMNMRIYGECLPQLVVDLGLGYSPTGEIANKQHQEESSHRPCYRWNNGHCSKPCKFRHVCTICSGSHRKRDCPKCRKNLAPTAMPLP